MLNLAELARTWPPAANFCVGCTGGVVRIDLDRHHGGADGIASFTALCPSQAVPATHSDCPHAAQLAAPVLPRSKPG